MLTKFQTNYARKTSPWLVALLAVPLLFSCKKAINPDLENVKQETNSVTATSKTIKDVVFAKAPDYTAKIIQVSPEKDRQRMLVPLTAGKDLKLYKYLITEYSNTGNKQITGNLVSKTKISEKDNLFLLPLATDGSINYFDAKASKTTGGKLMLKYNGKEVGLTEKAGAVFNPSEPTPDNPPVTGGYCIDHWWVTYDVETGEILSIEYLGSDCYECGETGFCGGGGGNIGPIDSSALIESAIAEYGSVYDDIIHSTDVSPELQVFFNSTNVETKSYTWIMARANNNWQVTAYGTTAAKRIINTKKIQVDNLKTTATQYSVMTPYVWYIVNWQPGSTPEGYINNNGTNAPVGRVDVYGNMHTESRYPGFNWVVAYPDVAINNHCTMHYFTGTGVGGALQY